MDMGLIKGIESHTVTGHYPTSVHAQNAIWLQVSIAAEFLIFFRREAGSGSLQESITIIAIANP